jgi:hypothetical protein
VLEPGPLLQAALTSSSPQSNNLGKNRVRKGKPEDWHGECPLLCAIQNIAGFSVNLAQNRTEESMKRVLIIAILSIFLFTGLGISLEQIGVTTSIVPTASAQTTVRRRRHKRSFWQKHRDKLTVAAGTAIGAGIGAGVGSKKAAAIGAGVGAGSSALYTYKLRKRHRRHRRY